MVPAKRISSNSTAEKGRVHRSAAMKCMLVDRDNAALLLRSQRGNVHTVVIEPSKGIGNMPVCATEIKQFARGMEFREVKLSFEFHRAKHNLNGFLENRNCQKSPDDTH